MILGSALPNIYMIEKLDNKDAGDLNLLIAKLNTSLLTC